MSFHSSRLSVLLTVLAVAAAPRVRAGELEDALKLLRGGDYARAEPLLRRMAGSEARLALARLELETGRYGAAMVTARGAAQGKLKAAALTVVAEAQRLSGELSTAETTLKQVLAQQPKHYRALLLLGMVYQEMGKRAEAKSNFDVFYDDYAADAIDKRSAEQLTYVAAACRYSDNFRDASDTLRDAVAVDPSYVDAHVQWGEISLEKYEAGYAEQHFQRALQLNPHHARALLGLAMVKLEQSNDSDGALKLIARAEQTNPQLVEAAVLRAQMLIDAEEHAPAEKLLQQALQQNPRHLGALSMLAASYFLRDEASGFQRLRAQVLQLNPRYTAFFRTVVELAVRHHRYSEAIELGKQAIAIDAQDWYALADLGTNYLRLGDEQQGLRYLKEAWRGDPFNVRTFNLLNLFEDVVAKQYGYLSSPHFRVRVHNSERALLERTVLPLLEQIYSVYVKKYHFTPPSPIIIELFKEAEHYAVRTVGLAELSALGVCFGRVITSTSPLAGRFNWGLMLWHELNHVFTIQLSRSRVPRWLTEGLADLEPALQRAEWRRRNDLDIYKGLRNGSFRDLASMTTAFLRAKSIEEMVVAYYAGGLLVNYLIQHWGMDKILAALRAYGKGQRSEQILPALSGLSLEVLAQRFRAAEEQRLSFYRRNWSSDLADYVNLETRRQQASTRPKDPAAQAAFAAALLVARQPGPAEQQAQQVLRLDSKNRLAHFVLARLAASRKDLPLAQRELEALVASNGDGFEARLALGELALVRKDLKGAVAQLEQAKRFDPEHAQPYALLAKAYRQAGRTDELVRELAALVRLDPQRFDIVAQLIELLAKRRDYAQLRVYGEMATYINPASLRVHQLLGEAYAAAAPQPRLERAIWHLETALLCEPKQPAVLYVELGKLQLQRGDKRRARAAWQEALRLEPQGAEARKLLEQLR